MNFTDAQLGVLAAIAENRLTVVRAGPGSGKTRVFVEALRRELGAWKATRAGVAALSFTNVAHEVITERLGVAPSDPHFVGTLDSFLWRFVVRPFGHLAGLTKDGPTLIPAALDEYVSGPTCKFGPSAHHNRSIFEVNFVSGTEEAPELLQRKEKMKLEAPFDGWNLKAKIKQWGGAGRVTHSDSAYLASCILSGKHGPRVVELVAGRFPVIFVDEYQDTGWFLSRALNTLLRSPSVRGAVVGDPDQAIYGFGGANRQLFAEAESIPTAKPCKLEESHRCQQKVAVVASLLSRSGKQVIPKEGSPDGRAILLVHSQPEPLLEPITAKVRSLLGEQTTAILTRKSATVARLAGTSPEHGCPWQSGVGQRLTRAVGHLNAHESAVSSRIVRRELCELILDDEAANDDSIRKAGVGVTEFRAACHAILMDAATYVEGESWNAWIGRLKSRVGDEATRLGKPLESRMLGARFKKATSGGDALRTKPRPGATAPSPIALTVHQAKGQEFDAVLLYVPKPHASHAPCPSAEWWSSDQDSEEMEVAFVACSRARESLVLAVHKKTHDSLKEARRAFYDNFEVHEVD